MNRSKTILSIGIGLVALFYALGCHNQKSDITEQKELLEHFLTNLNNEAPPVYHVTFPKKKIARYFGETFSVDHAFFLVEPPDSLDYYFDDFVISTLVKNSNYYQQLNITQEQAKDHMIVHDEDIPEFIKDGAISPPFNYSSFYNVYFLSTPIISQNRGIIFIDSYSNSGIGINVRFYVRKNRNAPWVLLGSGSVHELNYYINDELN